MKSTQGKFRLETRGVKGAFLTPVLAVVAYLMLMPPASAQPGTIFNYTSNPLSSGGFITASVTLPCSQPCAPGKYDGASMLALSLSYGSVTFSWAPGSGAPTDPWITLNSSGDVVDWNLNLINDYPFSPYANFTIATLNTTDSRYQRLDTADGTFTGGVYDLVTFRQAPLFELHVLESNGNSPGTWVATPVPESSSLLILATVGLGLFAFALRRA